MAVEGTPLEENHSPSIFDMGRMIATARVVMPKTMVRLSAGTDAFDRLVDVVYVCVFVWMDRGNQSVDRSMGTDVCMHIPSHPPTHPHLATGRLSFSQGEQALMFLAGANSIFNGDKLLTTPNPEFDADTVGG